MIRGTRVKRLLAALLAFAATFGGTVRAADAPAKNAQWDAKLYGTTVDKAIEYFRARARRPTARSAPRPARP